jgi:sulfate transport system substrate-binding protein
LLIENPIAALSTSDHEEQAEAFVEFARGEEAQRIFAEKGYRSVLDSVLDPNEYPIPPALFTIAELGGWPDVVAEFFNPEDGIIADIERGLGVPVE